MSKTPRHPVDISEEAGVRYLHFGSDWVQGAMRITRPWSLELLYIREMMAALLMTPDPARPRQVLLIGLGAASLVKFLHRWYPETTLTVVEINPTVPVVAQQFFKLPPGSPRLNIIIADAAEWIKTAPAQHFDLILSDGFGPTGLPKALDTSAYYTACRHSLSEQGIFVCNLFSSFPTFHSTARRISKAFAGRSLVFPPCESGNAICFSVAGAPLTISLESMEQRAALLRSTTGLNLLPTLKRLKQRHTLPGNHLHL